MIVKAGDPILRKRCVDVQFEAGRIIGDALRREFGGPGEEIGLGLAAPQIGVSVRVFVLRGWPEPFINPSIESASDEESVMVESCLSLPGESVPVNRPVKIKMRAQNSHGEWRSFKLRGLDARAAQHELDHLDGVLITDYRVRGA